LGELRPRTFVAHIHATQSAVPLIRWRVRPHADRREIPLLFQAGLAAPRQFESRHQRARHRRAGAQSAIRRRCGEARSRRAAGQDHPAPVLPAKLSPKAPDVALAAAKSPDT